MQEWIVAIALVSATYTWIFIVFWMHLSPPLVRHHNSKTPFIRPPFCLSTNGGISRVDFIVNLLMIKLNCHWNNVILEQPTIELPLENILYHEIVVVIYGVVVIFGVVIRLGFAVLLVELTVSSLFILTNNVHLVCCLTL